MKKLGYTITFAFAFLLSPFVNLPVRADTAQNVRVACFDIYVVNDPQRSAAQQYAGHLIDESIKALPFSTWVDLFAWNNHYHVFMLKNKTTSAFVNSTPIQVVRTITPDGGAP